MLTQNPLGTPPAPGAVSAPGGTKAAPPTRERPDFFIVGAPKCGTTAMADYLSTHPDIFMARKEMHFFGSDLRFAEHFYRRAQSEYLSEFTARAAQLRAGESSVWYLFSETAAAEIRAFNPEARIIIMLREPAEMMFSLFRYFQYDGNEPLTAFEDALAAEPERKAGGKLGRQTYFAQGLVYHEAAQFARQVQRYLQAFGRERVHIILHEDLTADAAGVYRDTLKFLQVDAAHTLPAFERVNAARTVKSRALRAVLNDPTLRSTVLSVKPWLPQFVFKGCQQIQRVMEGLNSAPDRGQTLSPTLKAKLRAEFASEVTELGDLIGRDLSHWTAVPTP